MTSCLVDPEESVKDLRLISLINTDSVIGNKNSYTVSHPHRAELYPSAYRSILYSILQKDPEKLLQHELVCLDNSRSIMLQHNDMGFRYQLCLLADFCQHLLQIHRYQLHHLTLQVSSGQKQKILQQMLHIFRFGAYSLDALLQSIGIGGTPALQHIHIAADDCHRRPQLVGRIGHKGSLMLEAVLQSRQHVIKCVDKLRQLIVYLRSRNTLRQIPYLRLPGGPGNGSNRLQCPLADHDAGDDRNAQTDEAGNKNDMLQPLHELSLGSNHPQEVKLVAYSVPDYIADIVIQVIIFKSRHFTGGITAHPHRPLLHNIGADILQRREILRTVIDQHTVLVHDSQDDTGNDSSLIPQIPEKPCPLILGNFKILLTSWGLHTVYYRSMMTHTPALMPAPSHFRQRRPVFRHFLRVSQLDGQQCILYRLLQL